MLEEPRRSPQIERNYGDTGKKFYPEPVRCSWVAKLDPYSLLEGKRGDGTTESSGWKLVVSLKKYN
jgi:hypothetical protein